MKTSRKRRILWWTLGGILLVIAYPLSAGPMLYLALEGLVPPKVCLIYVPLFLIPSPSFEEAFTKYLDWWTSGVFSGE